MAQETTRKAKIIAKGLWECENMPPEALQLIAQLGSTGIVLVILFALWNEYKAQAAYIRERLDQSDAERKVMAQALGLSTQDLTKQANLIRLNRVIESQEETH